MIEFAIKITGQLHRNQKRTFIEMIHDDPPDETEIPFLTMGKLTPWSSDLCIAIDDRSNKCLGGNINAYTIDWSGFLLH